MRSNQLPIFIAVSLLGALGSDVQAGTVALPLSAIAKRPASDLVDIRGRRVDEAEVTALIRAGEDISRLNPQESILWGPTKQAPSDEASHSFPAEGTTVYFNSNLASTKGIFRSSVDAMDPGTGPAESRVHSFTLSVSLSNPAAVMRADILRRLGYKVSNPKAYRELKVKFNTVAERDQFLQDLADNSLTSRERWVAASAGGISGLPKDKPEVTLQGVVLEPGRIAVQTVHWGLMSAEAQKDRRVFRALIIPNVLFDFQEKINGFAWQIGRIFNEAVTFDYLFSDGFSDVTYSDAKWIAARIAALTRAELAEAVARTELPSEVKALLLEKVVSRRNGLVQVFNLSDRFAALDVSSHMSQGNVQNGQLVRDDYSGYPFEFFKKPDLPPLRFSQLWRYAAIEGISKGLGVALDQINNKLLTLASTQSAVRDHQSNVSKGIEDYLFKTGSLTGFQKTTGVWAAPIAGGRVSANRNVVAGTYLGSDSQVQLVDSLTLDVHGGFYLGWDGLAPVSVGLSNTATLSRTYSHVKPVKDMNSALKTSWGDLVVVGFMRGLGGALNPNIKCEIPEGPWTNTFVVDGVTFTRINYDQNRANGKEEAIAHRAKLITEGANPVHLIMQANNRTEDCKSEVEKAVNKNLEEFVEKLGVGDTFIVTDTVKLDSNLSVPIPIPGLMGATVSPNGDITYEVARQTMLRRTNNGFQVYLQDHRLDAETFGLDVSFFVNIVNFVRGVRHGHADTDYYNIVTEGADTDTKLKLIRSIKGILRTNSSEVLADSFKPYTLKHDLFARIARFKFLMWSRESQSQSHEVSIYPPVDANGEHNRGDYKRTLAMRRLVLRTGQDIFGLASNAVGALTGGLFTLPGAGGGDPGNSPLGKSHTSSVTSQAEVTPGKPFQPVTALEDSYRGWLLSYGGLIKIFNRIDGIYGDLGSATGQDPRGPQEPRRSLFNRGLFNNTTTLQLYQVDSTLMIYPEGLAVLRSWLLNDYNEEELLRLLLGFYGKERHRIYCDIAQKHFGRNGPQIFRGKKVKGCAPVWVHSVMRLRTQGMPSDKLEQLSWYNNLASLVLYNSQVPEVLKKIGTQNFFFVTRVNGFRKNDLGGQIDYLTDTVGRYDNERGLGMYRDFSSQYGVSLFELYARFFTDGL